MRCKLIALMLAIVLAIHPYALADPKPTTGPAELDQRINQGLAYLARQQKADGSFEGEGPAVALTGLSLMAFLACGHTPDMGKYGPTVRSAVEFLIRSIPEDGYLGRDGGRMYGHAVVTLALAEVYGCETDPAQRKRMRTVLERAVKVLIDSQNVAKKEPADAGGWRYEPTSDDSDLSVTSWCALALRAAQNAGVEVPKKSLETAVEFIRRCYREDQKGFAYTPKGDASVSMTGAALLSLHLLDAARGPDVEAAAKYLAETPINEQTPYPYYALYYSTQAAAQVGDPAWPVVWKSASEQLARKQMTEGCWKPSADESGKVEHHPGARDKVYALYPTAMAVLTLSVPYRMLPAYQK